MALVELEVDAKAQQCGAGTEFSRDTLEGAWHVRGAAQGMTEFGVRLCGAINKATRRDRRNGFSVHDKLSVELPQSGT